MAIPWVGVAMSEYIERVFNITIPANQKILVLPSHPAGRREFIAHTEWLEKLADEGWLWQGQMQRNWHVNGRIETEFFCVFHRAK